MFPHLQFEYSEQLVVSARNMLLNTGKHVNTLCFTVICKELSRICVFTGVSTGFAQFGAWIFTNITWITCATSWIGCICKENVLCVLGIAFHQELCTFGNNRRVSQVINAQILQENDDS